MPMSHKLRPTRRELSNLEGRGDAQDAKSVPSSLTLAPTAVADRQLSRGHCQVFCTRWSCVFPVTEVRDVYL